MKTKKEITLKEAQEHIKEWGIDNDNFIQKNYQQFLRNGEHDDNTMDTYHYHLDRLKIVVEAGLKQDSVEPKVMEKIAEDHKQLKQEGWDEWIDMNYLTGITENQKQIIKTSYDYGWYCAYGLQSEDKRHSKVMEILKALQEKVDNNVNINKEK